MRKNSPLPTSPLLGIMSEPDSPTRGELHHQQQLHQSPSQHNAADERDDANNSIIGKVKSRVSSIFPQKLTKWFSPSTTTTTNSNGGVGRRRRRIIQCEQEDYERANNSDDESNNSADDEEGTSPAFTQPPTKRSRLNVEVNTTNFKDSKSLVSSTPTSGPRRRLTHTNLYGKQKEPAYSFGQTKYTTNTSRSVVTTTNSTVDSADIIEVVPDRNLLNTSISSSRRSLNIPSTSSTDAYRNLYDLKRHSVSKLGKSGSGPPTYKSQRTSTTILEIQDDEDDDDDEQEGVHKSGNQTMVVEEVDDDIEEDDEESEEIAKVTSKKQKFTNGNLVGRSSSVATESGESRSSSVAQTVPPKSGLFNPANRGLRTLSGNGLNFYSHLEGRKSLFSEKNMPGMLNNSTLSLTSLNRRQFNSSIYGSTSALSDSRLLNTSSPFYKGQTTYGGAAAYGKFNRTLNQSVRIAPTLIRPTSSLSTLSSSTNSLAHGNDQSNHAISSTAKRILELINDFSTPLNDAKKMASNIKTPAMIANRSASGGKRFSEADLVASRGVRLSTVRSPYTRPSVTLNPSSNESKRVVPTIKELQVPSMSQLLQMKKMQNCTERSRHIANTSKSALNQECEYKLPHADESTSADKNGSKHMSKIKHKLSTSSRVSSKNTIVEDEEAPAPANLPNIAFPFMQSVPQIDISVKSAVAQSKPPVKTDFKFAVSADAKPTNNFSFGVQHKAAQGEKSPTPATSKPSMNFNFGTSSAASSPIAASSNEFKFSSPLSVSCTVSKGDLTPIDNFKFSSPVMVGAGNGEAHKVRSTSSAVPSTVPQLKTGSVLDALKKPTEKASPITTKSPTTGATPTGSSFFGGQFKKPSNEWECAVCMIRNKEAVESCVACTTPRTKPATSTLTPLTNSLVKNTFGDAFKPKSDTWECDACMVRNKSDANECVACNTKKPGGSGISTTAPKLQSTDVGFKSLVAQQTASKWECDACMTRNDAERNKCVCCEQAKPGTQVVSDNVPQFSFGTSSASKFTFGFAGAKKEHELKAEAAAKTETQTTGFTFGVPATTDVANATVSSTGIAFGVKSVAKPTSSAGEDVPDVVKSNASGFKFGFQPADSNKPVATAAAPTGFSFGNKPDAKPSSVKFNLPPSTAESKPATTSASAITSTSSASTAAAAAAFNPIASSAFGAPQKVEETKPAASETNKIGAGFLFGAPASVAQPTNQQTAAVKPMMFGSSPTSEANKTPPKVTFGAPTTTASPSSGFAFGKPAATASPFSKSSSASSGFAFGKDQATSGAPAPSMFGSPASTSTAVNSSTTGFVFGKSATTTPMFGASAATTSATTSVFGSKSSAPTSTNSLTLASSSALASTSVASSAPFVFGSGAAPNALQSSKPFFGSSPFESGLTAAASTMTAPAPSSWPTNTFTFGSSKPPEEVKSNTAPAPAFGSPSPFGQNTSVFGSAQVGEVKPNPAAPSAVSAFGAPSATTSLFGSNATPSPAGAVQQTTGNLFGSASSTPIFGSMGFGAAPAAAVAPAPPANTNNVPVAAPTFGSSSSFSSGFGSIAAASSSSGNGDGASAPKKADIAFNFGSAQSSGNSGFLFGSNNNNKPAADSVFKFSTSATPRFNFTGSTEPSNAAQPFQFGAPTSTPAVFNFGGVEGSNSGGPFQFNAAAPAAAAPNNIFAPMPTPGSQASSQQARRKMRTSSRRITPR